MADQIDEVAEALGRSRAARGEQRPALPREVRTLPVIEQFAPPQERVRMQELEHTITEGSNKTPLQLIAERIKLLVHDHGEQFGDELKAHITDNVSLAKALQLWADDTLNTNKKEPSR